MKSSSFRRAFIFFSSFTYFLSALSVLFISPPDKIYPLSEHRITRHFCHCNFAAFRHCSLIKQNNTDLSPWHDTFLYTRYFESNFTITVAGNKPSGASCLNTDICKEELWRFSCVENSSCG